MAVAEQQSIEREPEPKQRSRQQAPNWPKPSQLRRSVPVIRLLAEIWAIPEVKKINLLIDGSGIYVLVLMPKDDRAAESKIYLAERDYLNATSLHSFDLHVVPLDRVPAAIVAQYEVGGYETILER